MQGCNAKCVYCHNPDTWIPDSGKEVDDAFIVEKIKKSMSYFADDGGVTFSGGEPLVQVKSLIPLMEKIKAMGVHTAIETNASIFNKPVKRLMDLTDLLLLDLKHIDPKYGEKITGLIFNPLKLADHREEQNRPFWLRYVLVPGFTDKEKHLEDIGRIFSGYRMLEKTEILPYHKSGEEKYADMRINYRGADIPVPDKKRIDRARDILAEKLPNVVVR